MKRVLQGLAEAEKERKATIIEKRRKSFGFGEAIGMEKKPRRWLEFGNQIIKWRHRERLLPSREYNYYAENLTGPNLYEPSWPQLGLDCESDRN